MNNRNYNYNSYNNNNNYSNQNNYDTQTHVHELSGSTEIINECQNCHNHRFCTMSGDAIRMGNSHVHEVKFNTDFADEHYHEFCGRTCPAIEVGNGKHVHYFSDTTESQDGHIHRVQAATQIDSPTEFKYCD